MDTQLKKQELVNEFNSLENRQREIMGALKILEEQEKEKAEEKPKGKKDDGNGGNNNPIPNDK